MMAEKKSRYCSYCKVRHPVDDFDKDNFICKYGRQQNRKKLQEKNKAIERDPTATAECNRCLVVKIIKNNFWVDHSRPSGRYPTCNACMKLDEKGIKKPAHYMIGLAKKFRDRLLKTILKSVKDQERTITRQLTEDFMHEGESITFTGREWQIQVINDLRPHVVFRKPSQKGLTWVLERFVFAMLLRYMTQPYKYLDHTGQQRSRHIEAIYSFETRTKASSWSKVRLKKIKNDNMHVRDALKLGETDSALLMQLGGCSLHLVGRTTVSDVLTISGDIVVIDEKDRDPDPAVSTQIGSRTLESVFMNTQSTKGVTRETSTPEVSGAGISLQYESSDQAEWEIMCIKCDTWQTLSYPECISNFYDRNEEPIEDKFGNILLPYWRCMQCHAPIDWKTIGKWNIKDPDYYENCRWVVRKPKNYNHETGAGIGGYQIPFAGPQRSAAFFLAERDDPEHDDTYLYNHMLGYSYDDVTKILVPDNFHRYPEFNFGYTVKEKYALGCDHHPAQGGFIVIARQIKGSVSPAKPEGKWVVVYTEHVKNNKELWDDTETILQIDSIKKGRLYELIVEFGISIAVVDIEPDTNEVEKLISEFSFTKKVWGNKSGSFIDSFTYKEEEVVDNKIVPICKMNEDKVAAIDYYFNKIRFGDLMFLEKDKYPERGRWQQFQDSHTNLYKGEVSKKISMNIKEALAAQNIREVYKKRVNRINDHWVMAGKFCIQGIRLLPKLKHGRRGLAPPMVKAMGKIAGT